jgi:hypothetical protein
MFDGSFDEDCLRCSECGCLPYSSKDWAEKIRYERKRYIQRLPGLLLNPRRLLHRTIIYLKVKEIERRIK